MRTKYSIKHESEARAVTRWPDGVLIVNELGYEMRL